MRRANRARRLLLFSSSFYSINYLIFFTALIPTILASSLSKESSEDKPLESLNLKDQKATTTAKMIEKIRDESVERILRLRIGLPSTSSFSDSEEDLFDDDLDLDDDKDQNVKDESLETITKASSPSSLTPFDNSLQSYTPSATSTPTALASSMPLRGRRSLRHSHHNSRRRRKGCPTVHGKTQFLCPSKNSNGYSVCITREQLCNHIVDCPENEDEDVKMCMFYTPIDDQLKTLSHAVLLLVDNVMGREQPKSEL